MKLESLLVSIMIAPLGCFAEDAVDDVSAGHGGSAHAGSDASGGGGPYEGVDGVFARACERLHGECASVCDNLFFECYDDVATCTEQWKAEYLSDYVDPIVDDALVELCSAQVDDAACTDLRPDTAECEYAIVDGCVGDADAHGAIYSPFTPGAAQVGAPIEVELCEWVEEYFAIELEAGATLELTADDTTQMPGFVDRLELVTTNDGDTVIERSSLDTPTAHAGTYLLAVETAMPGSYRFTVVPRD